MNSNTTEDVVKQKIESLNTLQAGIVFGHEDAWDKLQARLDAKPMRKPFPVFRVAAAAALALLLLSIGMMYLQPNRHTITPDVVVRPHHELDRRTNHDTNSSDIMVRLSNHDISIVQVGLERVGVRPDSFHSQNFISSAPVKPLRANKPAPHSTPRILPDAQSMANMPQPAPAVVPAPAVAAKPPMKVVHINELDKEQAPVFEFADKEIPHPHVMFKMKVIHINDLMKPISQDDYLRQIQNNTAIHFPLFHRPADRQPADQPKSFFRINLSN